MAIVMPQEENEVRGILNPWFRLDPDSVNPTNNYRFVGLVISPDSKSQPTLRLPIGYPLPKNADELAEANCLINEVLRVFIEGETKKKNEDVKHKSPTPVDTPGKGESISLGYLPVTNSKGNHHTETPADDPYGLIAWKRAEAFDELVQRIRQPEVLMTEMRQAWREGFDARHLHRMWTRALYCDDVPVFDVHLGRRHEMRESESHGILGLAAWLVVDYIKIREASEKLSSLGYAASTVQMLAQEFAADQGLALEATLWTSSDASQITRRTLNMAFADLLKRNPQRTPQADELIAMIDRALNTHTELNNGELWGMKGFADVWEAMCLAWVLRTGSELRDAVFALDAGHLHVDAEMSNSDRWKLNQEQIFYRNNKERRPDLVIAFHPDDEKRIECIVDFKYYSDRDVCFTFHQMRSDRSDSSLFDEKTNAPKEDWQNYFRAKCAIESLEAYRLLAAIHNIEANAESIPLEIWAPGDSEVSSDVMVLPNLKIQHLDIKALMENYLEMCRK